MERKTNNTKILVGMSGGVDSSVSAALLKKAGYAVSGVTLRLYEPETTIESDQTCGTMQDVLDARRVCDALQIDHYVLDLRDSFRNYVMDKFIAEYQSGRTPNPCIDCNRFIKFGEMAEQAYSLGMEAIATGHYAQIQQQNGRYLLQKPRDLSKDQTYVLYSLTQKQLSKTFFPLGGLTKNEVREFAAEHGFVNANKKDSQDICFVPDGDYVDFIARTLGVSFDEGDFVDSNQKIIGRHKGMIRYTIGQRKGLGMGFGRPMYVVGKEPFSNRVILGEEKDLYQTRVLVKDMNYIAFDRLEGPLSCLGKLRYRQSEQPCRLIPLDETIVLAEFDTPQRAVTAGQAAVFYDGNTVIGGGTIWEE